MLWFWAIVAGPLIRGQFAPTVPFLALFLASAAALRTTANPKVHGIAVVLNWLLLVAFIAPHGLRLGGVAAQAT